MDVSALVCFPSQNETRFAVDLNNFGFYANGTLDVSLSALWLKETLVNYSTYPVRSVCFCVHLMFI